MKTLSLAMIVKNEGSTIERVLNCAKLFCDEMIVVDTGSTDDTVMKAEALGATVYHFTWIDDFAAARNFSFSKCNMDWIIWLDGDDVITPENQQRILKLKNDVLNDELEALYLTYNYPPYIQTRERLIRRNIFGKKLEWQGSVHECIYGFEPDKIKYFYEIEILHATPPERHELKKDRNINILRKHMESGANDERSWYLYARECLNCNMSGEVEAALEGFFKTATYKPLLYEIYTKMYTFYAQTAAYKKATDALSKAIIEMPARAEAYYMLGKHLMNIAEDLDGAIVLLIAAGATQPPLERTFEVEANQACWEYLAKAYFRLEKYVVAKETAIKALQYNLPGHAWLAEIADYNLLMLPAISLPEGWQEWVHDNLNNKIPRSTMMRLLEENGFGPRTIICSLHYYDAHKDKVFTQK